MHLYDLTESLLPSVPASVSRSLGCTPRLFVEAAEAPEMKQLSAPDPSSTSCVDVAPGKSCALSHACGGRGPGCGGLPSLLPHRTQRVETGGTFHKHHYFFKKMINPSRKHKLLKEDFPSFQRVATVDKITPSPKSVP